MESYASVEAIVKLLLAELGQFAHMHIPVEGVVRIQPVPVLRSVVIAFQDRIRLPSLPVQVGVVSRIATALGV